MTIRGSSMINEFLECIGNVSRRRSFTNLNRYNDKTPFTTPCKKATHQNVIHETETLTLISKLLAHWKENVFGIARAFFEFHSFDGRISDIRPIVSVLRSSSRQTQNR